MLPVGVDERLYSVVSAIHGVLLSCYNRCYLLVMTNKNETLIKFERSKIFMEKLKFDQEESFLLSDGEYSIDTDLAIRRRTVHRTDDENMITRREYFIDGKRITVNSVFNMLENQSTVNGIRHLIDRDLQQQN